MNCSLIHLVFLLFIFFAILKKFFFGVICFYLIQSISLYLVGILINKLPLKISFKNGLSQLNLTFSWQYGLYQIVSVINVNIDNIFVGKFFGQDKLAYYSRGYQLFVMPAVLIGQVVSKVSFPYLKKANDDNIIYNYLRFSLLITLYISSLFSVFVYYNSDFIINVMYGPGWDSVIDILKIFSGFFFFRVVYKILEPVLLIKEKSLTLLVSSLGYFLCIVLSLVFCNDVNELALYIGVSVVIYSFMMSFGLYDEILKVLKNSKAIIALFFIIVSVYILMSEIMDENYYLSFIFGFVYLMLALLFLLVLKGRMFKKGNVGLL
nr:oligosaccharide flippase family protein [Photobacterium kishitanii]